MAQIDRGVYEPPAAEVEVFDASDEEDGGSSRLPLLIVLALVVLGAFGGVVWLAYNQGVARGRMDAPRVIAAPEGPVKTAPEEPAEPATRLNGLKIYSDPVPPDEEAETSTLAAPPAESAEPPLALATQPPPEGADGSSELAPADMPPAEAVPSGRAAAPAETPAAALAEAPADSRQAVSAALPAATSGAYLLQVGAYESDELAAGAWEVFKGRFGGIIGNLRPDIMRADLGDRGVWYRLRIGPFASRDEAAALCARISAGGGACFPVKS